MPASVPRPAYVLRLHGRRLFCSTPCRCGFLFGTSGYAGTFVAHNHGRGDARGVRKSVWLGVYTSAAAGIIALAAAWPIAQLFLLAGHEPRVARDEYVYFLVCLAGSFFPVLGSALAGWLSGIGRPVLVTWVTFISLVVNALLAWGLVLGEWGLPRMGIAGAALATVAAQGVAAILYLLLFARAGGLGDPAARRMDWVELRRFLSLAMPMGLRISGELAAWTVFLVVVGRLGTVELAASSIAFRINGTAFFPALGLGQAAGILVGHARGAGDNDAISGIAWQSVLVCEGWMLVMAVVFATASAPLMAAFAGHGPDSARIIEAGSMIMKFVAFYCLFDAANVMIGCVLSSAGDTHWLARTFVISSSVFLVLLWLVDRMVPTLVPGRKCVVYATAGHEVRKWHDVAGRDGLLKLIDNIKAGDEFGSSFKSTAGSTQTSSRNNPSSL